jgi:hypothetical protein
MANTLHNDMSQPIRRDDSAGLEANLLHRCDAVLTALERRLAKAEAQHDRFALTREPPKPMRLH